MGKSLDDYRLGQVVISKRGKDAGRTYVIVGFLGGNRLALADAEGYNINRPKYKNPKHVQPTSLIMVEANVLVEEGKNINRGRLCYFLESARKYESEQRGRGANGE